MQRAKRPTAPSYPLDPCDATDPVGRLGDRKYRPEAKFQLFSALVS